MKVVYILAVNWGGIVHYTAELANAISRYVEVVVLKPKDSNDKLLGEDVKTINVFKPLIFSNNYMDVFSVNNFRGFISYDHIKLVDRIKPDIIHLPEIYPYMALFVKLCKVDKKYPIIWTAHEVFDSLFFLPGEKRITRNFIHFIVELSKRLIRVDRIIVHSQQHRDKLIKRGINPIRITVIPHGAYTIFKKYDEYTEIKEENSILLFGHNPLGKGAEYLIKATPLVSKKVPDVKVIIAGEGASKCYKYITNNKEFEIYDEFIPNERVSELFQRAKVVVLPYPLSTGGHSGVLTIAFSFGKPIIVTNVGDFPNIVKNGREGFVVPPKNPRALADALIKILEDDKLRKKMERNALKKAEELSWDNIAKMHIKVYEEVLNERRSRS